VLVVPFTHTETDWQMCVHLSRLAPREETDIILLAIFRPSVIFKYLVYY
jgi:hypothetical protein